MLRFAAKFKIASTVMAATLFGLLCACSTVQNNSIDNNELFSEFTILPLVKPNSEQAILDTAYHTLQQLYPTSLVAPFHFNNNSGFIVDVEDIDKGIYDFNFGLGGSTWQPYAYQVKLSFETVLGRTVQGSIITGYRYTINVIPRSVSLFYIDDGSAEIDIVFRSELMKNQIASIKVTRVI